MAGSTEGGRSMVAAELTEEEYTVFCAFIYRVAGIKIPPTKKVMMGNRLRRRLRATGIAGFSAYYAHLVSAAGAAEISAFLDVITTNETYFYRDMHHFDWLTQEFFPEIAEAGRARKRLKRLRIWSAASSTGEELYSVALRLLPARHHFNGWTKTLLGTDLSGSALAAARVGSYDQRAVRLVPAAERKRYFDHDSAAERWSIKDEVRALAAWKLHNLLRSLDESPFDCIFIKNVLIYFDQKSRQTVATNLIQALAPGGYLVIGPSEGIYAMISPLEKRKSWLYQRTV